MNTIIGTLRSIQKGKINLSGKEFPYDINQKVIPLLGSLVAAEEKEGTITKMNSFDEFPAFMEGDIKVAWVNIGEGFDGDFNEENPEDKELLRFDIFVKEKAIASWEEVPDGSFCTNVSLPVSKQTLEQGLQLILNATKVEITNNGRAKKTCEALSWISSEWIAAAQKNPNIEFPVYWNGLKNTVSA